jgi:ribosomal protein S18 acetylase RimI-like enzyme
VSEQIGIEWLALVDGDGAIELYRKLGFEDVGETVTLMRYPAIS